MCGEVLCTNFQHSASRKCGRKIVHIKIDYSGEVNNLFRQVQQSELFPYLPFLHYMLVPSLQVINVGNTGNQNPPDLKGQGGGVLVTCISNIDFW